jgi:hypothetical protein
MGIGLDFGDFADMGISLGLLKAATIPSPTTPSWKFLGDLIEFEDLSLEIDSDKVVKRERLIVGLFLPEKFSILPENFQLGIPQILRI